MLSKNEQIIVYFLTVAVILAAGWFIFVAPSYNQIKTNQNILDTKQKELDKLKTELSDEAMEAIEVEIKAAYDEGIKAADVFYEEMSEYEVDQTLRQFLADVKDPLTGYKDSMNINTDNMIIEGIDKTELKISLNNDKLLEYPIREESVIDASAYLGASDESNTAINDENAEANKLNAAQLTELLQNKETNAAIDFYEKNKAKLSPGIREAMRSLLAGSSEEVAVQNVEFKINLSSEDINALTMAAIKSPKAMYIKSFEREDLEADLDSDKKDEETIRVSAGGGEEVEITRVYSVSTYTITMSFYCVKRPDPLPEKAKS